MRKIWGLREKPPVTKLKFKKDMEKLNMETITQRIDQIFPLLIGRSEEEIVKFLYNQNNNNWRRRNGYPMKRKALNKRKKKKKELFYG